MRFRVFVFLLFTTAILGFSQESQEDYDWYYGRPISNIIFSGLRNISHHELDAIMFSYRGRIFNELLFDEILGRLYALDCFSSIEPSAQRANPEGTEVIIRFNVVEKPIISRVNIVGQSGVRRSEINDVITTRVNDIYNERKIRMDIDAIRNLYIEKGYPNAVITVSEIQSGDSSIIIVFQITENDKITISRIDFEGNTRFTSDRLRSQISLKARSLIINDGAFQEAKLLLDRETITRYYRDRGFIDAVVRDVTRTYVTDERGTSMILTFWIDEG
jgi:outer membrane protein insertion porin family